MQFVYYKRILYAQYESSIKSILRYVEADIDVDDLAECIRTGEESEKYKALKTLLDQFKERLDIHFIYIIEPLNTDPIDIVRNVIAGATQYEYENEADELVYLNKPTDDSYSPETAKKYLDAYQTNELSFFEEISEWGDDYTGLLPLLDSQGNRVAALCVDVDIAQIHSILRNRIMYSVLLITLLGIGFIVAFVIWTGRNVTKPIERLESGAVEFASKCRGQSDPEALKINVPEIPVQNEVATLAGAVTEMSEAMQDYVKGISRLQNGLILVLADMVESRDKCTGDHVRKTAAYTGIIMRELKKRGVYTDQLTDAFMYDVVNSAPLHDIGKNQVSDTILNKPGKLTDEEFEIMKTHTTAGAEVIANAMDVVSEEKAGYLKEAMNLAKYHHEKWDGTGYPEGLKGDEIPLSARIMAVADVFDALVSRRSYKDAFPFEKAMTVIKEGSGSHFDPQVAEAFMRASDEVREVMNSNMRGRDD